MISAKSWVGTNSEHASIEVADLMKESGVGVVLMINTASNVLNLQIDLLDAAELIAAMTHAVRSQHEAMGVSYVCP